MFKVLLITFGMILTSQAFANDDDRQERRELRERREKVRAAIRRMEKCIEKRDLAPCMSSDDDMETRTAVMRYMLLKGGKKKGRRPALE